MSQRPTSRATPTARREQQRRIWRSQEDTMFQEEKVLSAVEMAEKLASHTMPSGFILVKMPATELKEDVLSIRMETLDVARGPLVVRSLTIYQDLRYQMHVSGREMSTSATAHLVRNTERFQTTSEVLNVLAFQRRSL